MSNLRNKIANAISNFAFRFIAEDWYAAQIERHVEYGMRSYARDKIERRAAPPPLERYMFEGFEDWRRFANLSDEEVLSPRWDRRNHWYTNE